MLKSFVWKALDIALYLSEEDYLTVQYTKSQLVNLSCTSVFKRLSNNDPIERRWGFHSSNIKIKGLESQDYHQSPIDIVQSFRQLHPGYRGSEACRLVPRNQPCSPSYSPSYSAFDITLNILLAIHWLPC